MNFVEPIRDRKKIAQINNLLCGQKRYHDLLLFVVGINTALRISDLLQLQINHFLDEQGRIKHRFCIKERKRSKRHEIVINTSDRRALGLCERHSRRHFDDNSEQRVVGVTIKPLCPGSNKASLP